MIIESICYGKMLSKLVYHPHVGVYILGSDKNFSIAKEIKLLAKNFLIETIKRKSVSSCYCALMGRSQEETTGMKLSLSLDSKKHYREIELIVKSKTPPAVFKAVKENIVENHPDISFFMFPKNWLYQKLMISYLRSFPPLTISEFFEMYLVPVEEEHRILVPNRTHGAWT